MANQIFGLIVFACAATIAAILAAHIVAASTLASESTLQSMHSLIHLTGYRATNSIDTIESLTNNTLRGIGDRADRLLASLQEVADRGIQSRKKTSLTRTFTSHFYTGEIFLRNENVLHIHEEESGFGGEAGESCVSEINEEINVDAVFIINQFPHFDKELSRTLENF